MSDRVRATVIIIVTLVWALNVTVPIFVKDYEPIPELNIAFMGMVGFIFAGKKNGDGGNQDAPPNDELEARRNTRSDDTAQQR